MSPSACRRRAERRAYELGAHQRNLVVRARTRIGWRIGGRRPTRPRWYWGAACYSSDDDDDVPALVEAQPAAAQPPAHAKPPAHPPSAAKPASEKCGGGAFGWKPLVGAGFYSHSPRRSRSASNRRCATCEYTLARSGHCIEYAHVCTEHALTTID